VTVQNTNDVVNVAKLVDHLIKSRGIHQTLQDSVHAPKGKSIINLPPKDLRHHLNALRHKPILEQPDFLLINASSIPGYNCLDKLNLVREFSQTLHEYLDLN